ncbi:TonB-dependent receptor domain-containing protein [Sphingobacterium sp. JUb56]|uniref:TonB-dependent receptor n=1 Tax=Sphingobacterium sp. JUb56 TaxID=2587145 RepID=UPI001615AF4E|nr:TonB-dependent receptor [Sphingobacterium sp. JUb56]MBB2949590.1 iron complex outermembrane receptor protein [Sphingobacterium sp. JUb56]
MTIKVKTEKDLPIAGATVRLNQQLLGSTDTAGVLITTNEKIVNQKISVSAIGFKEKTLSLSNKPSNNLISITLLASTNVLDEIVVTAGRKPESISTIPSSITILNQQDIQAQTNITNNLATVLGNAIPGLGTSTNKATNSGQTLRGRAVLVLIDGIPQSTPLMNGARDLRTIDPSVIERIEVIKGATSIYGNGSGGGIINYITKKNKDGKKISGQTILGTSINPFDPKETLGYRLSQQLSGQVNKWSYTVSGSADYNGLQRDSDGLPLGQTDGLSNSYQYNGFIKIGYQIDSSSTLTGFYNYYGSTQHAKYISKNGIYGQSPTIGVRGEEPGKPAGTPYNHNAMLTYSKSNLFHSTQLDVTAYLNSFSSMNRYVASGTAWYGPGQTMINSDKKGLRLNLNTPFQLFSIPTEITYGLDLLKDVTYQDLTDGRVYIPKMNMVNFAPYAQVKADLIENLIFKAGLRYENATVKVNDYNTIATGPNGEGSILVSGGNIPYKATMFNAGLRYTKYDYFNPFVSFSQAFAINELGRILRRAKENTIGNLETDPIITNNYEAGFSSRFSIFNISASYYISTSDLGVNLVDVGGFLMPQREPEEVKGYEVTLDAQLSQKLSVGGSYAYVEGKAKMDDGSKIYLNGSRIAPPKATGFLSYKPNQQLNLQLFWIHTGARDRFALNDKEKYNNSEGPISNVDLFNLSGNYNLNKNWKIGFGIENIFNTSYYPTVSQYRALDAEYVKGSGTVTSLNLHYQF